MSSGTPGGSGAFAAPPVFWRVAAAAALLFFVAGVGATRAAPPPAERSRRIRIEYDGLIDRSVIAHSGRTVGAVLAKARGKRPAFAKAELRDLQPYLEPFSFVLNDIAASADPPGAPPLANVADAWPPGSAQPAWAALFREGRYRLFYGGRRARLFLQGDDPRSLLRKEHGVVRHALLFALERAGTDRIGLEVYAFRNDYAGRALLLNPRPYVAEIGRADCAPARRALPLDRLAALFAQGPLLEAAEVDDGGGLFLHGRGAGETVAGRPLSLADFAVVYRAFFHYGNDPPYLSLDPAEDNRYAKVNFGGLLADTRVGSVLLDADRRFKTIVSGIDPDARVPAADAVRAVVPGFRTVDERSLFRDRGGAVTARFWFYPDRIRTVTDGRVGAVESHRFMADEERTDGKARSYGPGREAVDHLNRNYGAYARAFRPLAELDAIGRMTALVKWLQAAGAGRRVDLDALLSVPLPAHDTPRKVLKILAVTDAVRPAPADAAGERRKVFPLDNVLLRSDGAAGDAAYVENAVRLFQRHDAGAIFRDGRTAAPPRFVRYTSASISGGVSMDPAGLAPPRRAPDSPLLAKYRRGGRSPEAPPRGARASKRAVPEASAPSAPESGRGARGPGKAPRPADPAARKAAPGAVASLTVGKEIVVTSPTHGGRIVAVPDPSRRDTIVLTRPAPRGPSAPAPPAQKAW